MFSTPRHLSISSDRSHEALFVAANNASPDDWQTNHGSKHHVDDQDSDEEEQDSSSASPPLATTGARNVVSVASHSGAAEAEALAGLTVPRTDNLKRLPLKRHGEKPKRVKRPPNAYLLFNRDIRHQILDGNPNLTVAEISKAISERWNSLPEESKRYYNQEAARLKQRHMDEHPNFIYTRRSKLELEEAGYRSRPSKKRKVDDPPPASNSSSESTGDKPTVKERDPRGRKKKRLKNPTAPKHPMSGFLFYSKSVRAEIVVNMPKATVGEISKVIAKRWRRLTEEERAPWVSKAKEDKARYAREMETFTATSMVEGLDEGHSRQGNMSPTERELDSHTIATVAQMVNPRREHLMPPLSSSPRQYQVLPATPRNDD
ncbi:high mobility group box domain-containing protein [Fennellomyces sp. T-0311]|nr:high mobility group box domain-containing protein [Fennellomyces sp. T-0311]